MRYSRAFRVRRQMFLANLDEISLDESKCAVMVVEGEEIEIDDADAAR